MPSPDQVMTIVNQLAGNCRSMTPEQIEGKLIEATSFLKPAEERRIPEQIFEFRKEFAQSAEDSPALGVEMRTHRLFVAMWNWHTACARGPRPTNHVDLTATESCAPELAARTSRNRSWP
jgi:hypothetical protein